MTETVRGHVEARPERMRRRSVLASLLSCLCPGTLLPQSLRSAEPPPLLRLKVSDGATIALETGGSGPSLLLVHGSGGSHYSWSKVAPLLQSRFHTYAMDRRGHGDSTDGSTYSLAREAQDVVQIAAQLPEPRFVVGHSYGAIVTLEALRLTDTFTKAVIYEPPIPVSGGVARTPANGLCARVAAGDNEGAVIMFLEKFTHAPPSAIDLLRTDPMWPARIKLAPTLCREATVVFNYRLEAAHFSKVGAQLLFLLGGASPAEMSTSVRAVAAEVAHSEVHVLPGQKHDATMTAPQAVAREIRDFLLGL